jgi:hypothetical protein
MVKSETGKYHEGRIGGTSNGGLSLCIADGLAWCFQSQQQ